MTEQKPRVALLVGGISPEREVSKSSGKGVLQALKSLGYPTVIIDPAYGLNQPKEEELFFAEKDYVKISNRDYLNAINSHLFENVDVVFSAMHGKWAEDGMMQSLLELRGLKYTGSKVTASAAAMDKSLSKTVFRQAGVRTADWFVVSNKNFDLPKIHERINSDFNYPVIVKPNDQGSTVGLTLVKSADGIENAVKLALQFSDKALIEKYIAGREITVAILEDMPLPVLEIVPKSGLYDYKSKYTSGMSEYIVPAEIPEKVTKFAQEQALQAFTFLGCEGYARIDFRMNNNDEIFCLEVNTLPGMTPFSLVPKAAKAAGISFDELIDRIIKQAL